MGHGNTLTNAVYVRVLICATILLAINFPSAVSGFTILRGGNDIGILYDRGSITQKGRIGSNTFHKRKNVSFQHNAKCRNTADDDIIHPPPTINRSHFLTRTTSITTSALATIFLSDPIHPAPAAPSPSSPEAAVAQLKAAISVTDRLLQDWDTITSKGGDAIRVELGFNGGSSPLFQIDKAVKVIQREVAEDPVAFAEASEEFLLGLGRADSMAYSSIFAGGSGKPTPPSFYIAKSKLEVELIRRYEKEMLEAIGN